ncbi:PREDICTED: cysteine-rich and transmembrane domain-containing protein 1-like [Priapulus caudatus]|uniref:Cysteine-rich and transmembrane domain-containing protein 1-like n=1 Tax=Priapulus caudatus TaxID=37621 RepID=A0ABM1EZ26_PRICU|nr:PREDICTED: cysteine-rich and transmembrane domain-containing protein 1-like [Priapulus caudatus]
MNQQQPGGYTQQGYGYPQQSPYYPQNQGGPPPYGQPGYYQQPGGVTVLPAVQAGPSSVNYVQQPGTYPVQPNYGQPQSHTVIVQQVPAGQSSGSGNDAGCLAFCALLLCCCLMN